MANLFLMVGAPGSGKSTYLRNNANGEFDAIISRDEIRFSMLHDGEDYFSHENEVYKEFINRINLCLNIGQDVYVDATHLTPKSRKMLLDKITEKYDCLTAIVMDTPLVECLLNNSERSGRALVPKETVKQMYNSFVEPTFNEGFDSIIHVKVRRKF